MKTKEKENEILHLGPWNFCNRSNQALRQTGSRRGAVGRIPASSVAGGEGEVGEQLEEVKSYLGVGRIGVGDGRRGGVVEEGVAVLPKLIRLKCANHHQNDNQG